MNLRVRARMSLLQTSSGVAVIGLCSQPAQHAPGGLDPGQRTVVPHIVAGSDVGVGRRSLCNPGLVLSSHLGALSTQGRWFSCDRSLHVNIRELRAVQLTCQAFLSHIQDRVV